MYDTANVLNAREKAGTKIVANSSRPLAREHQGKLQIRVNAEGFPFITNARGITVNSMLRKDEWEELDRIVIRAAQPRLRAVEDLRARGLTKRIRSFGTLVSQYNVVSEMTGPNVSMTGQSTGGRDRLDHDLAGVPIPVIWKEFQIGARELAAARDNGETLDLDHVVAATRVVAEKLEDMVYFGDSTVVHGGATIYGYTTQPSRNTATATTYNGSGTWSASINNIVPTIKGMINAANNTEYKYGPFMLYLATDAYNEASLQYYTDGSGQTPLQRILQIPQIAAVLPADRLTAKTGVMAQMETDTIDWAEHLGIQVRETVSDTGMSTSFRVMAVAAPRAKADYNGRCGIVHVTGLLA